MFPVGRENSERVEEKVSGGLCAQGRKLPWLSEERASVAREAGEQGGRATLFPHLKTFGWYTNTHKRLVYATVAKTSKEGRKRPSTSSLSHRKSPC